MRSADVKIGGESAASVPIQIIGDSAVPGTAPTTCSTGHTALGTAQAMEPTGCWASVFSGRTAEGDVSA